MHHNMVRVFFKKISQQKSCLEYSESSCLPIYSAIETIIVQAESWPSVPGAVSS